ncbi:MAG: hypothetical protein K0S81_3644, partial [Rhodospirillales bacterium]|nr:hypothetical protein [Rhodospirillales bacterium]
WGIGLAALWSPLRRFLTSLPDRLDPVLPLPERWSRPVAVGLAAMALLFLLVANPASIRTATFLADVPVPGEQPNPDWPAAKPLLEPLTARVPVLVTTEELGALYYLGRFDVRFSPSKMHEFDGKHEFAADPRTGRAVISTPEALQLLFQCFEEGLLVIPSRQWNREHILSESVRELILDSTQPVPLPQRTRILAYTWQRPKEAARPAECTAIPAMPGLAARVPGH